MLVPFPPVQALLEAAPDGWRKGNPRQEIALWTHTNGLHCTVRRIDPRLWSLSFTAEDTTMSLSLPKRHEGDEDIAPLLRDLAPWIQALDLAPMQSIAQQLSAWLCRHGKTGAYRGWIILENSTTKILLESLASSDISGSILVPEDFLNLLHAETQDLWSRMQTPHLFYRDILSTPDAFQINGPRQFHIQLETTAHARMELITSLRPELRDIPLPG